MKYLQDKRILSLSFLAGSLVLVTGLVFLAHYQKVEAYTDTYQFELGACHDTVGGNDHVCTDATYRWGDNNGRQVYYFTNDWDYANWSGTTWEAFDPGIAGGNEFRTVMCLSIDPEVLWQGPCGDGGGLEGDWGNQGPWTAWDPIWDLGNPTSPGADGGDQQHYVKDAGNNYISNYNYVSTWVAVNDGEIIIKGTLKERALELQEFHVDGVDGPINKQVGQNFIVNWNVEWPLGGLILSWNGPLVQGTGSEGPVVAVDNRVFTCSGTGTAFFSLLAVGPGGNSPTSFDVTREVNCIATPAPPPGDLPTVDLKFNNSNGPVTVNSGDSGTLSWTTTNATFCDASQGPSPWNQYPNPDPKVASGESESTGSITASATYEIYCENAYGTVYDSVVINVSGAPLPPTVTLTFNGSGSPAPINSGESGTLAWTISGGGATSCTASGAWSGNKNPASGSEGTGSITSTRTYTLDCTGTGGSGSDSVTVTVAASGAAWTCTVAASPNAGARPLNGVDVTVTSVNNTCGAFSKTWIDCTNDGTWEDADPGSSDIFTSVSPSPGFKTIADICNYATKGTYTINVKHERQGPCAGNDPQITYCTAPVTVGNIDQCVSINAPDNVNTSQNFNASVTVRNTGGTTWSNSNYAIAAPPGPLSDPYDPNWDNPSGHNPSIHFSRRSSMIPVATVVPNEQVTFNFDFDAPSTPNTYPLRFRMLQSGVEWFDQVCEKNITVTAFNYSLSNSGTSNVTKTSGNAFTQNTITKTLTSGVPQSVNLSVSGQPPQVSVSISNQGCSPACTSVITFTVPSNTPAGTYPITVTGSPASSNGPTTFNLVVSGNPMTVSCSASPTTALLNQTVTWTANVSGGTAPFTYSWSGTNIPSNPAPSSNPFNISYSTIGQKNATVAVTDVDYPASPLATCVPAGIVQINFSPTFEEF